MKKTLKKYEIQKLKADRVILKYIIKKVLKVLKTDKKMEEFTMGMGVAGFQYNGYSYGFNYESEGIEKINKTLGEVDELLKSLDNFQLGYALQLNKSGEACFKWGGIDDKVVYEKLSVKEILEKLM